MFSLAALLRTVCCAAGTTALLSAAASFGCSSKPLETDQRRFVESAVRHTKRGRAEGCTLAEATASAISAAVVAIAASVRVAAATGVYEVGQGAGGLTHSSHLPTATVEAAAAALLLNHLSCFRC